MYWIIYHMYWIMDHVTKVGQGGPGRGQNRHKATALDQAKGIILFWIMDHMYWIMEHVTNVTYYILFSFDVRTYSQFFIILTGAVRCK